MERQKIEYKFEVRAERKRTLRASSKQSVRALASGASQALEIECWRFGGAFCSGDGGEGGDEKRGPTAWPVKERTCQIHPCT